MPVPPVAYTGDNVTLYNILDAIAANQAVITAQLADIIGNLNGIASNTGTIASNTGALTTVPLPVHET